MPNAPAPSTAPTPEPSDPDHPSPLLRLFHPRSVAIVGVSSRPDSLNARPLRYLLEYGFDGAIYPVNPGYSELEGLRCYPRLADIPDSVDLVLVMVPAAKAPGIIREAGAVGAFAAVVFSSGFTETGAEGARLQHELGAAGRETGVRVLGPNCQGLLYGPTGLAATFTAAADRLAGGASGVAYIGQSGAVGGSILDLATEMGLGLTAWVSTGNQADLDLVEVASALVRDPAVHVIMLYAETIGDGAAYTFLARAAHNAGKRLVVLRSGRSDAGRRAAASHTGSMLADDSAFVLTSRRYGVILVDDVDDLLAVAATVSSTPAMTGRRVGVVTTSGGAGSLAADHCASHDLDFRELSADTQERLTQYVPDFGAVANPVDVTAQLFNREGQDGGLGDVCSIVAHDPQVDLVAVVLTMVTGPRAARLAQNLVTTAATLDTPVYVAWLAGQEQTAEGRAVFREAGIPVFSSVGALTRVAGLLAPGARPPARPPEPDDTEGTGGSGAADVLHDSVSGRVRPDQVLAALDIARPASTIASTRHEAIAEAQRIGRPVALKLHASSLAHKSDVGAVRLGVPPEEVGAVVDQLMEIARRNAISEVEGVLVQEMVPPGTELIVGATSSTNGYPPVVTVGIGGVTTELYGDIASELAPVTAAHAETMLRDLRGWPLLAGFRGAAPADVAAAAHAVAAVSRMAADLAGTGIEFEINPLVVAAGNGGAFAVDLLVNDATTP